jgi:hypothetical protein
MRNESNEQISGLNCLFSNNYISQFGFIYFIILNDRWQKWVSQAICGMFSFSIYFIKTR